MNKRTRTKLGVSLAVGALLLAACGGGSSSDTETTDGGTETTADGGTDTTEGGTDTTEGGTDTTEGGTDTTAEGGTETTAPESKNELATGETAMTVTYTLSDVALWSDGTPITVADVECTWKAKVLTTGSIETQGYDLITGVTEGATPQEVVVTYAKKYAPWRTLFNGLLKASEHPDCADVSADFDGSYKYGSGPYVMTEWTPEQAVYEKNANYKGAHTGGPDKIVHVPAEDAATALKSGAVDFVFPQAYTGIDAELADPNVEMKSDASGNYEALYFMQDDTCTPDETRSCAFMDDAFREAFSKSVDTDTFYKQIYEPFAQGIPLLTCGPIAPGPYCNEDAFKGTYDPDGAKKVLTDAGWTQDGDGMWVNPDGEVPEIHWMVNTGNARREGAQEVMIPLLKAQGFNVIADNCEATPCVFQTRLPAQKYDLAMYISTVAPDPAYVSNVFTCDQRPTEENNFQGQNATGWCNEQATADLKAADEELDEAKRAELVKSAIQAMADDSVLLPLLQFANVGAFRKDRVSGTQNNLANYWSFKDWWNFEDLDGDGQVVLGASQFVLPDCANPITECANSSWFQWIAGFPTFPALYDTTNDQKFEPSENITGEATVDVA